MNTTTKRTGRPSKNPTDQTFKNNAIHALLIGKLPAPYVRMEPNGNQSILDTLRLARALGVSRYTVYRFLNDEKLSKKTAAGLVRISDGALEQSDVLPYLMRL
ncbi:helix-turn-helix DNA binding domain protein [Rhodobacter phage RcPacific]|nr:helix-turn-helix DNA binding domain protein [Rhodobacter phage RcGingersnap]QXN71501.1 helix-turn-helix DNA binding domain protein [Rhodobacter phage RcIroh]QXN71670.1 helix-turn-helix DNA binding domain protein [Rhodobacter phage RcMcDreamy]QXN72230.1 helix-turn-helix DNA binding domain protein [Rhodobacter phage RcSalem]UUV42877.1 helix-turn-helix DNA binding domain protein [Rhodobacter phage RcAqua]UUV42972.1 helix-turn-helix DNA binding domain protein [Rhodobacter phage RcAquaphina]UUV